MSRSIKILIWIATCLIGLCIVKIVLQELIDLIDFIFEFLIKVVRDPQYFFFLLGGLIITFLNIYIFYFLVKKINMLKDYVEQKLGINSNILSIIHLAILLLLGTVPFALMVFILSK
jgi:hypothetical protein